MKIYISKFYYCLVLVVLWAMLCSTSIAQSVGRNPGPCPSGSAPVNGSCGSPSNAGSIGSQNTGEVWKNHYGAIAASVGAKYVGVSNNQSSMRNARKVAIKKCGKSECRIVQEYVNACGSVAWGGGGGGPEGAGVRVYAWGASESDAEKIGLKECAERGGHNCVIDHVGCSLPERVQ